MKNCTVIALKIHERIVKGVSNVAVQLLNEKLSPIEAALVGIRLYDIAGDYHKGIIARAFSS